MSCAALVKDGGLMVVGEAMWLVDTPPAIAHWKQEEYPLTRADENIQKQ